MSIQDGLPISLNFWDIEIGKLQDIGFGVSLVHSDAKLVHIIK